MAIRYLKKHAALEDIVTVEDAETLLEWLKKQKKPAVTWGDASICTPPCCRCSWRSDRPSSGMSPIRGCAKRWDARRHEDTTRQATAAFGGEMMKSVFLVDDSSTMLMSLKSTLEISGFKVDTATDGEQALGKLKSGLKPDLIITDINMPRMDGITLIQEARKILRFTPILALTTESQQTKRDEAKKLGATGWLVKPVAGTDLVRIVKQVVPGA